MCIDCVLFCSILGHTSKQDGPTWGSLLVSTSSLVSASTWLPRCPATAAHFPPSRSRNPWRRVITSKRRAERWVSRQTRRGRRCAKWKWCREEEEQEGEAEEEKKTLTWRQGDGKLLHTNKDQQWQWNFICFCFSYNLKTVLRFSILLLIFFMLLWHDEGTKTTCTKNCTWT